MSKILRIGLMVSLSFVVVASFSPTVLADKKDRSNSDDDKRDKDKDKDNSNRSGRNSNSPQFQNFLFAARLS